MSSIQNRIVTTYSAHGGNVLAVQNQIAGGMRNIGRVALESGRNTGIMQQQMRAFGTTLRYAFAGSTIFGAINLLNTLRETQRQLALIRTIGDFDEIFGTEQAARQVDNLYSRLQRGALETLTPVGDLTNATLNLYSTVQGLTPDRALDLTTALSQGAQLAQVPVEDLTKSISGLNQAFGRPHTLENYNRAIRGFFTLTSQAPGGISAGPQFIQQLAPLAAVSRLANVNPEQMYGLYLTSLRFGGTPSTTGRGLQYLLQSIASPASEEAGVALRRAGITPQYVQQVGGLRALQRLIQYTRQIGIRGERNPRLRGATEEQLDILDQQGGGATGLTPLGVSGPGVEFLSTAIGRIHGVRALISLMSQGDQAAKDIQLMARAQADTAENQREWAAQWERFARDQPLQGAAIALDVVRRNIATAFEPLFNFAGAQIGRAGYAVQGHPGTVQRGIQIGGGLLAAAGLARFFGGGRFTPFGLLGRGASAASSAQAVGAQLTRGFDAGIGATPANPLFVREVGNIFGGGGRGGRGGAAGDIVTGAVGASLARRIFGPLGRGVGAGVRGLEMGAFRTGTRALEFGGRNALRLGRTGGLPAALAYELAFPENIAQEPFASRSSRWWTNWMRVQKLSQGQLGGNAVDLFKTQRVRGEAVVDVLVRGPGGKVSRKRVHIPLREWDNRAVPRSRGRAGGGNRSGSP